MSSPPSSPILRYRPLRRSLVLTQTQQLDQQASQLIINALERTNSAQPSPKPESNINSRGSFSKMSFSSMMGGLSMGSLSLSRTSISDRDTERGRSTQAIAKQPRSSSHVPPASEDNSRSRSRARSQSPFSFRRFRQREPSPTPQALPLTQSDIDLSSETSSLRPRNAFTDEADDSGDDATNETDDDDEQWSGDDDMFDPVTERNTEHNSIVAVPVQDDVDLVDPLGEGVNVVVPPDPYFPTTLNAGPTRSTKRNPRRRKSVRHEPLALQTSRPIFQRDRCTITITQGDPGAAGRRRRYIVASDLSEESRYAVEWGIGTVIRDGDEMMIVNILENETKVDPPIPNAADRAGKLRSQQERQALAYILCRQATGLLQRTKLNVTVVCQAWHAKNARHMLLDIVDYYEPQMLIVGSRGLGQLKGILLGSTSHYLIEKCSVPVMVARRRLKRPPRRSAHLATHRAHVSLAEAGIDRVAPRVDADVQVMRDELAREEGRREGEEGHPHVHGVEEGVGDELDGGEGEEGEEEEDNGRREDGEAVKVAG
ncbi:hypothetical protein C8F04DRAFT_1250673 [Mycena alexandri]|uniref:UspA domain-containing protein n=1 Tax=Mycena alexandri TaxID=1745969 RepID=A0AAD6THK9_9AGAR|nr:hypothetical protein C8F04DRAFT_1250673 [Mycena alexandri]